MPASQDPLDRLADLARVERLRVSGEARRIRLAAGIPAQEIADVVGVHVTSVLGWEEGLKRPRATVALKWLEALDRLRHELGEAQDEEGSPLAAATIAG